jgi:hypothetical protein
VRGVAAGRFLSQEVFDSISEYVITGRQLCGRTINVTACDYQILSFPICIDHEKVSPFAHSSSTKGTCGGSAHQYGCPQPPFTLCSTRATPSSST